MYGIINTNPNTKGATATSKAVNCTSNALSKEAIWKTLQSAENNGAIAPGMAKKIFTVLNLGGNGGSDDGSGGNSVNISNTDSFFDSVDQSANDATPDGEIGDKSIGSSKKETISDENLSTVLTDALVGSMFNEENEPRNRTLSVEQQQLQEQMKRSNLDAVEEEGNTTSSTKK